jgi:UDP-3-O-[3-hydroxymyristoyl] glucosamine N-acyltransferase
MELTLREVAALVGGEVIGDAGRRVRGVCALEATGQETEDHVAFVAAKADPATALKSQVRCLLVAQLPESPGERCWVKVADPHLAFALVAQRFHPLPRAEENAVHPTAVVAGDTSFEGPVVVGPHAVIEAGTRIGGGTVVMAGAFVGEGCRIGRDCIVYPRAVLYTGTVLGDRVRVHAGAVIGADGFGNARQGKRWVRIPQIGNVVLEDDVEIGANTTVDRATLGETRVGRGTKIDNLVMIAHNCRIGEDSALAAQVGMAGSTTVGSRVQMAGQVGLAGHLRIADDVVLGAQAGVMSDIEQPGFYLGAPARPGRETMRIMAELARLPELRREVAELEKRIAELEAEDGGA